MNKRFRSDHLAVRILTIVAAIAFPFLVRFYYLHSTQQCPFFAVPYIDAAENDAAAVAISQGNVFGSRVFYRAPAYEYFLAGVYTVFGQDYYAAKCVHALIGAANCILIFLIGLRLFDRRVAVIGYLIGSLYGTCIFYETELLRTGLAVFLALCALLLTLNADATPSYKRYVGAGIIFGLAALTRENILIFLPLVLVWIWANSSFKLKARRLRYSLAYFLSVIAVIAPVTVRNYVLEKDFVLISAQAGINFYIGNCNALGDLTLLQPGVAWMELSDMPHLGTEEDLKPSQWSLWYFRESYDFICANPAEWAAIMWRKFCIFCHSHEFDPNNDIDYMTSFCPGFGLLYGTCWGISYPFGIIAPLAIVGLVLSRSRHKQFLLLYLFTLSYSASIVTFHVRARYRLPLVPILIIFAAHAVVWYWDTLKNGGYRAAVRMGALLLICGILVNVESYEGATKNHFPRDYYLSKVYQQEGSIDKEIDHLRRQLTITPGFGEAQYNLGLALEKKGLIDEAIDRYKRAIGIHPRVSKLYVSLGNAYFKKDMFQSARRAFESAVRVNALDATARFNLGNAFAKQGAYLKAIESYRRAIAIDPEFKNAMHNLGAAYHASGLHEEAVNVFKKVLKKWPDFIAARRSLVKVYSETGQQMKAEREMERLRMREGNRSG